MYTSITRVRTLTGFTDTTNMPNSTVAGKIRIASAMIDSAIGYNYSLPLPYRYGNTLTFSAATVSTGTMAIVVNGTTYNITIEATDTASSAADKFRVAAADSEDFQVDDLGSGAEVLIISLTDSATPTTAYAEVNITSAPTTGGISGAIGTREKRYPLVIEQYTAEIAAALLFIDQYGVESQNTGKDGKTRMDAINEQIQKLQGVHESEQRIKIMDEVTHLEIPVSTDTNVVSYPNDTSEDSDTDPTSPIAYMNKVF